MAYSGLFKPKHPSKYIGDVNNIVYRSSWELRMMSYLDGNKNILQWASEEFHIPYYDPVSNRARRYFPDFYAKTTNKTMVIEVKPYDQTMMPMIKKLNKRNSRKHLKASALFATNVAKWKSAKLWCESKGWEFKVITEKEIFGNGPNIP